MHREIVFNDERIHHSLRVNVCFMGEEEEMMIEWVVQSDSPPRLITCFSSPPLLQFLEPTNNQTDRHMRESVWPSLDAHALFYGLHTPTDTQDVMMDPSFFHDHRMFCTS